MDLEEIGGDADLELGEELPAALNEPVASTAAGHALLRPAIGDLDHVRGLQRVELAEVALARRDAKDFQRQEDGLLGRADLKTGKLRVAELDIVLLLEVVGDGLLGAILAAERKLLGGLGSEAEDLVPALRLTAMGGLNTGDTEEALQGVTGATVQLKRIVGPETEEVTGEGDEIAASNKGSGRSVNVQQETAESGAEGEEEALPDVNATRDGDSTLTSTGIDGTTHDNVALGHRVTEDDFKRGDDIVGSVSKLSIDKVLQDSKVNGADLAKLENKVTHFTRTASRNGDLDAELVLGEETEGVDVGHAIIGKGTASKLTLAILGLELAEQGTPKVTRNLRGDLNIILNDLTNGQTSDLTFMREHTW